MSRCPSLPMCRAPHPGIKCDGARKGVGRRPAGQSDVPGRTSPVCRQASYEEAASAAPGTGVR